jgi:hypothetical protein
MDSRSGVTVDMPHSIPGAASVVHSTGTVGKTASFFEFSLCLSRACLGKMFVFIYKWRKNAVFRRLPDFGSGYLKDLGCSNTDTSLQCPAGVLPPEMNPADIGAKNALVWSHFHQH